MIYKNFHSSTNETKINHFYISYIRIYETQIVGICVLMPTPFARSAFEPGFSADVGESVTNFIFFFTTSAGHNAG